MVEQPEFELEGISEEEFDNISDSGMFVEIPTREDGVEREGDNITLDIEATACDWKTPGKSLALDVQVITPGNNYGKTATVYPPVSKEGLGITKGLVKAMGVADKVFVKEDGKVKIRPLGFVGGQAKGKFIREMSQPQDGSPGQFRSVLTTVNIKPKDEKDLGIG